MSESFKFITLEVHTNDGKWYEIPTTVLADGKTLIVHYDRASLPKPSRIVRYPPHKLTSEE